MHISEGILSAPVLVAGAALTTAGTYWGLKRIRYEDTPKVGILSSTFFVASLIHVPLGPTSVHLLFNGLNGLLLGWAVFPSLLVALFFQAVLFQFGGITTLGVNTFNMAFPGLISWFLFRRAVLSDKKGIVILVGAVGAALSIAISGMLVATELYLVGQGFLKIAELVLVAHIPIMVVEAVITPVVILFLKRVKPEVLGVKR